MCLCVRGESRLGAAGGTSGAQNSGYQWTGHVKGRVCLMNLYVYECVYMCVKGEQERGLQMMACLNKWGFRMVDINRQ